MFSKQRGLSNVMRLCCGALEKSSFRNPRAPPG